MTIDDYEKIYELWTSSPGMGLRSLDDTRDGINKFLLRNPRTCFVAESGGTMAGVILCGHDGRRGYIYHAVVKEDFKRKGIGRRLVAAAEESMKREGINKLALVVFSDNKNGNEFWEHTGYGPRPDLVYRDKSINDANL